MYAEGDYTAPDSIYSNLDKVVKVDLQYHFSGPIGASYWIKLCQLPEYGHPALVELIDTTLGEVICALLGIVPQMGTLNLVSLGPGDGEIDIRLLGNLENRLSLDCYYCLDSSFELLRHAVNRVLKSKILKTKFRIKAICCDFTQRKSFVPDCGSDLSVNLFSLTGFTLGNYNEVRLLGGIAAGMSPRDFLFLDARLHSLESCGEERELTHMDKLSLLNSYSQEMVNRFVFGPVEVATTSNATDVNFDYEVCNRITVVPKALNVIICCGELRTRMRLTGELVERNRLELAATTLYSYPELLKWFPTAGFQVVWHKNTGSIGLFLLRKK
jgi:hypothetical protein